jgi:alpha-glucosidase
MPWSATASHGGFSPAEPWLPIDPRHLVLAVDQQSGKPDSVLETTRLLLALRHRHGALARGELEFLDAADPVLAFERREAHDRVLCVFNLGAAPARWPAAGRWRAVAGTVPAGSMLTGSVDLRARGFFVAVPAGD